MIGSVNVPGASAADLAKVKKVAEGAAATSTKLFGSGAPTGSTIAVVGQNYIDEDKGTTYTCISVNEAGETVWVKSGATRAEEISVGEDGETLGNTAEGANDAKLAVELLTNAQRQNAWEIERGTVVLTNTEIYPFNDSQISIPLAITRESNDYVVHADVIAKDGNAGHIVVSDKLSNGFKLAFTGSAKSVTVKYSVIGGYLK